MAVRLTILGSGTSHGIPMIACSCPVCTSDDPRDKRTRTSALFSYDGRHVLVDTAPELRLQCLAHGVDRVDAVLYTHAHADHIVGLDDLRRFTERQDAPLKVYGNGPTIDRITRMFAYAFNHDPDYPSAKPQLVAEVLDGPIDLFGRTVTPLPYMHGTTHVLGFRVGDIAYCPDCSFIPDATRDALRGLDVLVLDALRRRPHPTHFNLAQALAEAKRIGAARTAFTHIAHELGHTATNAELPPGIGLTWDGAVYESG